MRFDSDMNYEKMCRVVNVWVIVVILMFISAACGFFVGVAYGQEHSDE